VRDKHRSWGFSACVLLSLSTLFLFLFFFFFCFFQRTYTSRRFVFLSDFIFQNLLVFATSERKQDKLKKLFLERTETVK
jgi:hypothetical protein